jgi:hypothetical protein
VSPGMILVSGKRPTVRVERVGVIPPTAAS